MKEEDNLPKTNIPDLNLPDEPRRSRDLRGVLRWVAVVLAVVWAIFQLYTGGVSTMVAYQQRAVHLGFTLALTFLWIPASKKLANNKTVLALDAIFAGLGLMTAGYAYSQYLNLVQRVGMPNMTDQIMGFITVVLLLEITRRLMGKAMVIIAIVFLAYALLGQYLPAEFGHKGYSVSRVLNQMFLTNEGIFGLTLGVSATFVYLFVMFGTFLEVTGAGQVFLDLALGAFGRFTGGPAKVAVIASSLFGTVSGSAAANVVGTGSVTIPLMKRIGYPPQFAAAVEAVASTGGQLMPPIMGAAAFIMSDVLRVSYTRIILAAVIPAFLYYMSDFIMVHFRSKKLGLQGLPQSELPKISQVLKKEWYLLLPLIILILMLSVLLVSPMKAVFWSLIALVVIGFVKPTDRMTLGKLVDGFVLTGRNALLVAAVCATAGIVIGVVNLTGLGLKLSNWLVILSGGHLLVLLILTMIASIILGMGLPTTACYVILSAIVAPSIIKLGVVPLAAHMFVFYFGIISAITPPVAGAAYVGAGIAGSDPLKTGWTAVKLGGASYIIPFMFVYGPPLLWFGAPLVILQAVITASLGVVGLAIAIEGWLFTNASWLYRAIAFIGALLLIYPGTITDLIGLGLIALVFVLNFRLKKVAYALSTK
ncbi:MAG: TRAP transporter permease [Desulfitobacteriaceae bacterium]|nr:TRAP transporter permease [Desulfitobacteriaceae bacterium]